MTTDPQLATIEKGLRELTSKIEKLVPGADTPAQVRAIEVASKDLTEKIGKLLTPPTEQAQIAEYNSLSSFISNRRTQQMTVNALLVTGAGLALTFAVGGSASARVSGWIALIPALLVSVAWINWRGLRIVDGATYDRLHEIEDQSLHVEGHRSILKKIEKKFWYMARDIVWDIFYAIILIASGITSAYLFWPGIIP